MASSIRSAKTSSIPKGLPSGPANTALKKRIDAIGRTIAVSSPKLTTALKDEKKRLEQVLRAGDTSKTGALSPDLVERLKARVVQIDGLFMIAMISEKGIAELNREKASIQELLKVA